MNRARVVMAVLSAIACVTMTVPLADAGGGMGGGAGTYACRTISNGVNPPQVVSLDVDGINAPIVGQVGPPMLLCDLITDGTTVNNADPTANVSDPTHTICYPINGPDSPKQTATVIDPFTTASNPGSTDSQTVTVGGVYMLCVAGRVSFQP